MTIISHIVLGILTLAAGIWWGRQQLQREIRAEILTWVSYRDHDSCWFYPDIFMRIASKCGLVCHLPTPGIPRSEFEKGCEDYANQLYGHTKRQSAGFVSPESLS